MARGPTRRRRSHRPGSRAQRPATSAARRNGGLILRRPPCALHVVLGETQIVRACLVAHLQALAGVETGQVDRPGETQVAQVQGCMGVSRAYSSAVSTAWVSLTGGRERQCSIGEALARRPGTLEQRLDDLLVLGVHAGDAAVTPDGREDLEELVVGDAREAMRVGAEEGELESDGAGRDERADVDAT